MKIKSFNFNFFTVVIVLAILATLLSFWEIFFSKREKVVPPPAQVLPTPTSAFQATPTLGEGGGVGDSPEEILKGLKEEYPLRDYVPYIAENFAIDYLKPLSLKVFLKKDTPGVREEVLAWIRSKGVDPTTHRIDWGTKP